MIEIQTLTLRSPELFLSENSLLYFLASHYLIKKKKIKFKILSRTPWLYSNSFVTCDLKIFVFLKFRKTFFIQRLIKSQKHYFVKKHLKNKC